MAKYQKGDFNWCGKGEAVFAMQNRLAKLERSLMNGDFDFDQRHFAQTEVEDLNTKITRRRNMSTFDLEGFFDAQKRFQRDPEYREMVVGKIEGTWVDPEVLAKEKEKAEAAEEAEKESK